MLSSSLGVTHQLIVPGQLLGYEGQLADVFGQSALVDVSHLLHAAFGLSQTAHLQLSSSVHEVNNSP